MTQLLALNTERTSLIWELSPNAPPRWRHWGERVVDLPPFSLDQVRGPASFSLDQDSPFNVAPSAGWLGHPSITLRRSRRRLLPSWSDVVVERGEQLVTFTMTDQVAKVELRQTFALDAESDVATVACRVRNIGDEPIQIDRLTSAMLPLPPDYAAIRSFTGRHNAELVEHIEAMPHDAWMREQRRGITGHGGPPGVFVLGEGAGYHSGRVHAAQLVWSGNHRLSVERDDEGFWCMSLGVLLEPGEIELASGESMEAPAVLATFAADGLNRASQNFHASVRSQISWPGGKMRPRPVHLNSWEAVYFEQDEAGLKALASKAASIGVERFIVDDGWFRGRRSDRAALGDWEADSSIYPNGLGPLADHVVGLGLEFGLWVEPEMVSPDSDLFRAHPDWVLGADHPPLPTARHQLVLDLGRADVRDYLFDALDTLLRNLPIHYLKWDHNRDLAPLIGADGRSGTFKQTLGVYELMDRIRRVHPAIEIEGCAGGGGRTDAGMAGRVHRFWTTDNLDAVSRVSIQRGFLAFLPPELMGCHVGASPAHATGRSQSLAFRAAVALPGHFGIEFDLRDLGQDVMEELQAIVARYKSLRDRLHSGNTWLGSGPDGILWHAVGSPSDFLLFVIRVGPPLDRRPQPIRLPYCSGQGQLNISLRDLAGSLSMEPAPWFDRATSVPQIVDGDWLAKVGLPIPALGAESVAIFSVERP